MGYDILVKPAKSFNIHFFFHFSDYVLSQVYGLQRIVSKKRFLRYGYDMSWTS